MANTVISIMGHLDSEGRAHPEQAQGIVQMGELLRGIAAGIKKATRVDFITQGVQASGTITLATASGVVGVTINGITVSRSWTTSDAVTAGLIAGDINARPEGIITGLVSASAVGAVVTITSLLGGVAGNAFTIAAVGTGVTASAARLAGGTETRVTHLL